MRDIGFIIVDDAIVVCVNAEKIILVREVCKHFSDRWRRKMGEAETEAQKREVLSKEIGSMMKKMSIECTIAGSSIAVVQFMCTDNIVPSVVNIRTEHVAIADTMTDMQHAELTDTEELLDN